MARERPELVKSRWPEYARERWVPIPSAGVPTDDERNWRRHARGKRLRTPDRWNASIRAKTMTHWCADLTNQHSDWFSIRSALRAVRYLKHIVTVHEERIVRSAREAGWCWDEIGVYLGISRQAVHQRWARRIAGPTNSDVRFSTSSGEPRKD